MRKIVYTIFLFLLFSCDEGPEVFTSNYLVKEIKTETTNFNQDKPWESKAIGYINVIYEDSIWKLWYEAFYHNPEGRSDYNGVLCYAYSYDGIEWVKPNLGLHTFKGMPSNIIFKPEKVNGGIHGVGISKNIEDVYKYTMAYSKYTGDSKERPTKVFKMSSNDGINWNEEKLILDHPSDTQNILKTKDDYYYLFFRRWSGGVHAKGKRQIGVTISENLSFNNKIYTLKLNGESIQKDGEYYNSSVKIIDNNFLFFPTVFYPKDDGSKIEVAEGDDLNYITIIQDNDLKISNHEESFKVVSPQIISNPEVSDGYYIYVMEREGGHYVGNSKRLSNIKRISFQIKKAER